MHTHTNTCTLLFPIFRLNIRTQHPISFLPLPMPSFSITPFLSIFFLPSFQNIGLSTHHLSLKSPPPFHPSLLFFLGGGAFQVQHQSAEISTPTHYTHMLLTSRFTIFVSHIFHPVSLFFSPYFFFFNFPHLIYLQIGRTRMQA